MKNLSKKPRYTLVLIVIAVSIATTTLLYVNTPNKRDDIHVELIKLISQGVVIGVLGLWVKQLFEDSSKERELERIRLEKQIEQERNKRQSLQKTIDSLVSFCQSVIGVSMREENALIIGMIYTTRVDGLGYPELIRRWRLLEPDGPANRAAKAFNDFMSKISDKKNNEKERKEMAKLKFSSWLNYYDEFSLYLALGQYPCSLDEPEDWKLSRQES